MRRPSRCALICALFCLLLGVGRAAAEGAQARHPATTARHAAARPSAGTRSLAVATLAASAKATTKDGLTVLNDCQDHGQLTRAYPEAWLRKALSMMSSDTAEYSNCSTVLHQAILHTVKQGSGGSSGSGTTTIVIIIVVVLVVLAALLGVLALRRRRSGGPPAA